MTIKVLIACTITLAVFSCSSAGLNSGSVTKQTTETKDTKTTTSTNSENNNSTSETKEEPAVDPTAIAGMNLVLTCSPAVFKSENADISCVARDSDRPNDKIPDIVWTYELGTPLTSTQTVTTEETPTSQSSDTIYHLKGKNIRDVSGLVQNFVPVATKNGKRQLGSVKNANITCSGKIIGGYCWYESGNNTDCNSTCSQHGGVTDGTIIYAGYPSGSIAQCSAVLEELKMGTAGSSASDSNSSGYTAGCGLFSGSRIRYIAGPTVQTNEALMFMTSRVCSCAK